MAQVWQGVIHRGYVDFGNSLCSEVIRSQQGKNNFFHVHTFSDKRAFFRNPNEPFYGGNSADRAPMRAGLGGVLGNSV
jgi:hypothetical protein